MTVANSRRSKLTEQQGILVELEGGKICVTDLREERKISLGVKCPQKHLTPVEEMMEFPDSLGVWEIHLGGIYSFGFSRRK